MKDSIDFLCKLALDSPLFGKWSAYTAVCPYCTSNLDIHRTTLLRLESWPLSLDLCIHNFQLMNEILKK